ncbi:MAG: endonuclease III [Phycisphaerales bacterium]
MSGSRGAKKKLSLSKSTPKSRRTTRAGASPKSPTSSRRDPSNRKPTKASRSSPKPTATPADISPLEKLRALRLLAALRADYPDAHCELVFSNPHELLVATILSAQATDVSVNKVTPALFARFPSPAAYAAASAQEIEPYIKSIGLFRNKARAVHESMTAIRDRFGGQVPRTMQELLTLRGVARKTANVVLGNCFNINDGVVVDTHVQRLSRRFALAPADASVADIEQRLMQLFPRDSWCLLSHLLIFHGRRACKARGVRCDSHPICREFGISCECR